VILIKFIENYVSKPGTEDSYVFERNQLWEFTDKVHIKYVYTGCEPCEQVYGYAYRIRLESGVLHYIPEALVTCIDSNELVNWDYTQKKWNEKITTDALVEDGNYVKVWEKTFGIAKPVKDRADQCDYSGEWWEVKRKIDEFYRNEVTDNESIDIP